MSIEHEIEKLKSLLSAPELITPDQPSYHSKSQVWCAQKDLHPKLVIEPSSPESLAQCLQFLSQSSLHFDVRTSGTGSATAKDVLISMAAFKEFEFDREKEEVVLGAGCLWSEYYKWMEEVAPEFTGTSMLYFSRLTWRS
jgi:FAD/FMN-containing dehydrogenase